METVRESEMVGHADPVGFHRVIGPIICLPDLSCLRFIWQAKKGKGSQLSNSSRRFSLFRNEDGGSVSERSKK